VGMGVKRQHSELVVGNGNFQCFRWLKGRAQLRPALLFSYMQSLVGFPLIPQYMTLNDLDCFDTHTHAHTNYLLPRPINTGHL